MLARRLSDISEEKSEQLSWLEKLVEVKVATIKLDLVWEPTKFMFCLACLQVLNLKDPNPFRLVAKTWARLPDLRLLQQHQQTGTKKTGLSFTYFF